MHNQTENVLPHQNARRESSQLARTTQSARWPCTHTLSDFLRELKKASSTWVHQTIELSRFAWQEGYSAFTVSPTARASVRRYIKNQPEHHRKLSFRDELLRMLKDAGVDYDPRYLD